MQAATRNETGVTTGKSVATEQQKGRVVRPSGLPNCWGEQSPLPALTHWRCDMSRETPKDDPRKQTDPETFKQTEKPWEGNPEKEQPQGSKHDLEKWHNTETH